MLAIVITAQDRVSPIVIILTRQCVINCDHCTRQSITNCDHFDKIGCSPINETWHGVINYHLWCGMDCSLHTHPNITPVAGTPTLHTQYNGDWRQLVWLQAHPVTFLTDIHVYKILEEDPCHRHTINDILFLIHATPPPPTWPYLHTYSSGSTRHPHTLLQDHAVCLRHMPDTPMPRYTWLAYLIVEHAMIGSIYAIVQPCKI